MKLLKEKYLKYQYYQLAGYSVLALIGIIIFSIDFGVYVQVAYNET